MQTVVPACTRLNGQTSGPAHWPSTTKNLGTGLRFTAQDHRLIETELQGRIWRRIQLNKGPYPWTLR
jgi:hypothetical protein